MNERRFHDRLVVFLPLNGNRPIAVVLEICLHIREGRITECNPVEYFTERIRYLVHESITSISKPRRYAHCTKAAIGNPGRNRVRRDICSIVGITGCHLAHKGDRTPPFMCRRGAVRGRTCKLWKLRRWCTRRNARCRVTAINCRLNNTRVVDPVAEVNNASVARRINGVGDTSSTVCGNRVVAGRRRCAVIEASESHVIDLENCTGGVCGPDYNASVHTRYIQSACNKHRKR